MLADLFDDLEVLITGRFATVWVGLDLQSRDEAELLRLPETVFRLEVPFSCDRTSTDREEQPYCLIGFSESSDETTNCEVFVRPIPREDELREGCRSFDPPSCHAGGHGARPRADVLALYLSPEPQAVGEVVR